MTVDEKLEAIVNLLDKYEDPKPEPPKNTCFPLIIDHIKQLLS